MEESQAKASNLDLHHSEKVLSMQDSDEAEPAKVEEVLEVVTAAKLMTKVVTTTAPITTATQVLKVSAPRIRRGVAIQDPEETATATIDKDEAFSRQLEAKLNANINWNDVIEEDLETLWKLVKEIFESTEPKNVSDDFLLNILKIMFEKPNVEANMFLLVEKKNHLTHFTLEQMLNNVRLKVKEESEMSLELPRLVRRLLDEGFGVDAV
uniref:Uncharacterized protein n=1 Tax=Tanacetum cinerariifolium TaxID=118510 RepID=A0A6L2J7H9_TANCI|nr:hypothetical protein [Tanacetum cinerariifolium]